MSSIKTNALAVLVEDVLSQLRVPSVESLATEGVRLFGDDMSTPMVLLANQDNQGGPMSNFQGVEMLSSVFFNVLAVVPPGDLELATQIDDAVRRQLLATNEYTARANSKGTVYSITLAGNRSYVGPGLSGANLYLYHGGYYRARAEGRAL